MKFKQILQKLKFSNRFNGSSLSKKIIANIGDVNQTELLDVLELLHDTADMEYQVKLISILTAYLLFNNSDRDILIKSPFLYEPLRKILSRGLPLKTTISLNFITCLLCAEDDGGSRSRTLTLHAQNLIRTSGCLIAMIQMFMNVMLQTETWQALCRCLAEVCRGSEPNQNCCSHLVPLCVQRCLQGNLNVVPVLQSLLTNHKRNTNLFMETNGAAIFNRRDYIRLEECLQLLNTVIQNAEVEAISTISSGINENLNELLKVDNANFRIVQWMTVISYHLGSKLKNKDKCYVATRMKLNEDTLHMDSNFDDTQMLLQNIMTEIICDRSKTHAHIPFNNSSKAPHKLSNIRNNSRTVDVTKLNKNKSNNSGPILAPVAPSLNFNKNVSEDERLSFSFLFEDNSMNNLSNFHNKTNNYLERKVNETVLNNKRFNQSIDGRKYSNLCDTLTALSSKYEHVMDFKPTFASTPRKLSKMHSKIGNAWTKTSITGLNNKSRIIKRKGIKKIPKRSVSQEKHNIKHKSMSSRILDVINESCTTVIESVKNVFAGNKSSNVSKEDLHMKSGKEDQKSYCSYSFTNYMHKREAGLMDYEINKDDSSEMNTLHTLNMCNTCDDTLILQQKVTSNEQLKSTVQKLKLGINLYGCDFKRISRTMWPRDSYMTPDVLYNLYRKLLLK